MQLCLAYRNEGGRVIVVLSQVPKTEMEEMFRYIIPDRQRYGSTFVFRQGNPLLPDALRMVAASSASATVIVTDTSRRVPGTPQLPQHPLQYQCFHSQQHNPLLPAVLCMVMALVPQSLMQTPPGPPPSVCPKAFRVRSGGVNSVLTQSMMFGCRGPNEADAQSTRAAILLDELDYPGQPCRCPLCEAHAVRVIPPCDHTQRVLDGPG